MEHQLSKFAFVQLYKNELCISNPQDYSEGFFKIGNILIVDNQRLRVVGVSVEYLLGQYYLAVKVQNDLL